MKEADVIRYEENQIYLLNDGSFVLITDVDPVTKLNATETSRRCSCRIGHPHKYNEQFKKNGEYIVVVVNEPMRQTISIDISNIRAFTISELRTMEAIYVGKLSETKIKEVKRMASEYIKTLD